MADTFHLRITSPDRVFYEGDVTMVEINTTEGQIGVLPNHIPLTSVLSPGACYIHLPDGDPKVCAIHGGFFEILQDSMTILAEVCEWPDEIDLKRAEEARIRAERRLSEKDDATDIGRATLALKRSAARIEAARK
jgi:F-type H+-transporting ATPase subunit epsilon